MIVKGNYLIAEAGKGWVAKITNRHPIFGYCRTFIEQVMATQDTHIYRLRGDGIYQYLMGEKKGYFKVQDKTVTYLESIEDEIVTSDLIRGSGIIAEQAMEHAAPLQGTERQVKFANHIRKRWVTFIVQERQILAEHGESYLHYLTSQSGPLNDCQWLFSAQVPDYRLTVEDLKKLLGEALQNILQTNSIRDILPLRKRTPWQIIHHFLGRGFVVDLLHGARENITS